MVHVKIFVKGHLDEGWSEWFEGFTLIQTGEGETVLTGKVRDQAELYGVIAKLRDLGVNLVSVRTEEYRKK